MNKNLIKLILFSAMTMFLLVVCEQPQTMSVSTATPIPVPMSTSTPLPATLTPVPMSTSTPPTATNIPNFHGLQPPSAAMIPTATASLFYCMSNRGIGYHTKLMAEAQGGPLCHAILKSNGLWYLLMGAELAPTPIPTATTRPRRYARV